MTTNKKQKKNRCNIFNFFQKLESVVNKWVKMTVNDF